MKPDDLYEQAVRITQRAGRGSATVLREHFHINYSRAVNLLDLMEDNGVIESAKDAGPRKLRQKGRR